MAPSGEKLRAWGRSCAGGDRRGLGCMSPPWMPLYIGDYLADTAHLSTLENGAYLLLIMSYWRRGGLPDDDAQLARIARLPLEQWLNVRSTVVQLLGNGWAHKRIDLELQKAANKSEKASWA